MSELWNDFKQHDIHVIGVPGGEEGEGIKIQRKKMTKQISNLMKTISIQV